MRIAHRSESAIQTLRTPVARSLLLCVILSLAACGGGGGSDDEAEIIDASAPTPPVVQPDPSAPTPPVVQPDPNPGFTLGDTLFPSAPAGLDFYLPPNPLPGSNGDVLWATQIPSAASNGRVWQILYRSESLDGTPIAVSGWLAIPNSDRPAEGYPIVAFAHGTTGLTDHCAPTRRSTPIETIALLEDFLARGFVVSATDYEGLGTPGLHQYLVGPSESRSVLDSARAAQRIGGGSDELILFGHSQGGHAVILANEMAPSYAPKLKVLGTIGSGSGVFSASTTILDYMKNSDYKGYLVMVALGQEAAYGAESPLSRWLTDDGIDASSFLKDEEAGNCVQEVKAIFAPLASEYLFVPNAPQPLLATDQDSIPGGKKGASPLLMIHGKYDDQLPPSVIIPWVESACTTGQEILLEWFNTGHRVPYPDVGDPVRSAAVIFPWIDDRFADRPAPNSCGAVPLP